VGVPSFRPSPDDPPRRPAAIVSEDFDVSSPPESESSRHPVSRLDLKDVPYRHPAIDPNEGQRDSRFADAERVLFEKTENCQEEAIFHAPSGENGDLKRETRYMSGRGDSSTEMFL